MRKCLARQILVFLPLIPLFSAAGCGKSEGSVSGKVTYEGKAVTFGTVIFFPEEGTEPVKATIAPDGAYVAKNVTYGLSKVVVFSPKPRGAEKIEMPTKERMPKFKSDQEIPVMKDEPLPKGFDAKTWFALPAKYARQESTDVTFHVQNRESTFDIQLKRDPTEE